MAYELLSLPQVIKTWTWQRSTSYLSHVSIVNNINHLYDLTKLFEKNQKDLSNQKIVADWPFFRR